MENHNASWRGAAPLVRYRRPPAPACLCIRNGPGRTGSDVLINDQYEMSSSCPTDVANLTAPNIDRRSV